MNKKTFFLLIAISLFCLSRNAPAYAYTVTNSWTSKVGWGVQTTNFTTNTDFVYINVEASHIPEPISGLWMRMQWYKPNGEREYDLGTNIIAHPVYSSSGLLIGFWAEMAIKGMDREPGVWLVEHYAYGYIDDVLDWHKLFTLYFTISADTSSVSLKSAGLWSEHRYEADSGIDSYFMLSDATTDNNSHNVYIQNVPNATGDLLMTYLPGWSGGGTYEYGDNLTSPAPGSLWEKTYTIYIDSDDSGNKTTGDPERSFQINSGTISKMDLVTNVKISGGIHPIISWTGVSRADQYRVRLHPVVNGKPSTDAVYFDYSPSSSGSGSFSYTYNGDLFSQYDTLAIGIEAREIINGRLINRSRYLVKHSANSKATPWIPLLLLDKDNKTPLSGNWSGSAGFGELSFTVNATGTGITKITNNYIDFSCGPVTKNGSFTTQYIQELPINNGQFTMNKSSPNDDFTLSGMFGQTGMSVSGSYNAVVYGTTCQGNWNAAPD